MITLISIIIFVIYPISIFRIQKHCKNKGLPFNIIEAGILNYMGFAFGTVISIATLIHLCIHYLP